MEKTPLGIFLELAPALEIIPDIDSEIRGGLGLRIISENEFFLMLLCIFFIFQGFYSNKILDFCRKYIIRE